MMDFNKLSREIVFRTIIAGCLREHGSEAFIKQRGREISEADAIDELIDATISLLRKGLISFHYDHATYDCRLELGPDHIHLLYAKAH